MEIREAKCLIYLPITFVSDKPTLPFYLLLPSSIGANLKGNNLLLLKQIVSFKSRPHFWKGYVDNERK